VNGKRGKAPDLGTFWFERPQQGQFHYPDEISEPNDSIPQVIGSNQRTFLAMILNRNTVSREFIHLFTGNKVASCTSICLVLRMEFRQRTKEFNFR
jgi:hypothetical protein